MDRDLGLFGTDGGHVRAAAADAGGSLHQNRDAGGVAIGTVVVRGDFAQNELHEGQCGGDHADDGDDRQHDIDRARGMGEHRAAQQQQQGGQNEAAEDNPFNDRKRRQNRVLELGARLAAVVMSHKDDLAAAGVARFGRVARLVFRDDVLADAAREQTGKDRLIERLSDVDGRRQDGDDRRRKRHDGQQERQNGENQGHCAADRTGKLVVGHPGEVLDNRRKPGFLLHMLGNV